MTQIPRTPNDAGEVKCPACQTLKPLNEYYNNKRTSLGISTYCKSCQKEKQKKYSPYAKAKAERLREEEARDALIDQTLALLTSERTGPPTSD